jgi:hypothetical protein
MRFEASLVMSRTTAYLTSSAFLLAAFGTQSSDNQALAISIATVGIVITVIQPLLIARTIQALEYWRATAILIESDEDYWFPGIVLAGLTAKKGNSHLSRNDTDLDFTAARQRWVHGLQEPRQHSVDAQIGRPPEWILRMNPSYAAPHTVYSTVIPLLVLLVWFVAIGTIIFA